MNQLTTWLDRERCGLVQAWLAHLAAMKANIPQTIKNKDAVTAKAVCEILLVTTSKMSNVTPRSKCRKPSSDAQIPHGQIRATFDGSAKSTMSSSIRCTGWIISLKIWVRVLVSTESINSLSHISVSFDLDELSSNLIVGVGWVWRRKCLRFMGTLNIKIVFCLSKETSHIALSLANSKTTIFELKLHVLIPLIGMFASAFGTEQRVVRTVELRSCIPILLAETVISAAIESSLNFSRMRTHRCSIPCATLWRKCTFTTTALPVLCLRY